MLATSGLVDDPDETSGLMPSVSQSQSAQVASPNTPEDTDHANTTRHMLSGWEEACAGAVTSPEDMLAVTHGMKPQSPRNTRVVSSVISPEKRAFQRLREEYTENMSARRHGRQLPVVTCLTPS